MTRVRIADVVRDDLCIGCGLCEAATGGRVRMALTSNGSLRPTPIDAFRGSEEDRVLAACPGVVVSARSELGTPTDEVWGAHRSMVHAWAGDPDVRFRGATGGVLTAIGMHLLDTDRVGFVLQVAADPDRPLRAHWVMSESPDDVRAASGSRYGPTAPLAGFDAVLDRAEPFAIIAKPCDLNAVHAWSQHDERVDRWCRFRLALVCGGQSRLTKTLDVLDGFGVAEHDVVSLRYRGNGNPGPTRVETRNGAVHQISYLDMWADESSWDVETRCKLCPDALGEAADIAAADAWPGGAPTGEDEGFNAIVVRNAVGAALVDEAARVGALVLGDEVTPREFDALQPHQVRKKEALAARYAGVADAGVIPIETHGLRIRSLGSHLTPEQAANERAGARSRMEAART